MKKLSKLKLNQISKNELEQRAMNALRGGGCGTCSCSCDCKKEENKSGNESSGCDDTGRNTASADAGYTLTSEIQYGGGY